MVVQGCKSAETDLVLGFARTPFEPREFRINLKPCTCAPTGPVYRSVHLTAEFHEIRPSAKFKVHSPGDLTAEYEFDLVRFEIARTGQGELHILISVEEPNLVSPIKLVVVAGLCADSVV